jgi:peptidoglycan/LPS O-acetylase OafA/YrhL
VNNVSEQRTISIGPLVGLVGGVLLFVSLFLSWWEGDVTAFTAFEVLDLLLALLALGAVVALADALGLRLPGGSPTRARLALPLGAAALLIILTQLINDPPAIVGSDRGPEIGLWLGLAGALLIVGGGLLAVARVSLALDFEQRERRRAAAEPPRAGADAPAAGSEAPTTRVEAVDPDAPPPAGGPERRS